MEYPVHKRLTLIEYDIRYQSYVHDIDLNTC